MEPMELPTPPITLTLQTSVKYVLIALRADNKGEGGILALYALLRKHKMKWLYIFAIIGAATLIADGVITPSITVVSAIEGLNGIEPSTPIVPISILIVTILFFIQQFGTNAIGKSFGPMMLVWFTMLGVLGISTIPQYLPIFKAFNPYYAVRLLIDPMDMRHYDKVAHGLEESYEDVQPGMSTPYGIAHTSEIILLPSDTLPSILEMNVTSQRLASVNQLLPTPEYLHRVRAFGVWSLPDKDDQDRSQLAFSFCLS